jgi:hypothetical protein
MMGEIRSGGCRCRGEGSRDDAGEADLRVAAAVPRAEGVNIHGSGPCAPHVGAASGPIRGRCSAESTPSLAADAQVCRRIATCRLLPSHRPHPPGPRCSARTWARAEPSEPRDPSPQEARDRRWRPPADHEAPARAAHVASSIRTSLSENIQKSGRVPGLEGRDCERRGRGRRAARGSRRVIRRAQVTDRAPVTGWPSDLTSQVSSGRATGEHEPLGEHESTPPSAGVRKAGSPNDSRFAILAGAPAAHRACRPLPSTVLIPQGRDVRRPRGRAQSRSAEARGAAGASGTAARLIRRRPRAAHSPAVWRRVSGRPACAPVAIGAGGLQKIWPYSTLVS